MRHAFMVRLAATVAFALLALGPLALPSRADAGASTAGAGMVCHTERSLVNGQWIDMPSCRRAGPRAH